MEGDHCSPAAADAGGSPQGAAEQEPTLAALLGCGDGTQGPRVWVSPTTVFRSAPFKARTHGVAPQSVWDACHRALLYLASRSDLSRAYPFGPFALEPCRKCCRDRPNIMIGSSSAWRAMHPEGAAHGPDRVFLFDHCRSYCTSSRLHFGGRVCVVVELRGPEGAVVARAKSGAMSLCSKPSRPKCKRAAAQRQQPQHSGSSEEEATSSDSAETHSSGGAKPTAPAAVSAVSAAHQQHQLQQHQQQQQHPVVFIDEGSDHKLSSLNRPSQGHGGEQQLLGGLSMAQAAPEDAVMSSSSASSAADMDAAARVSADGRERQALVEQLVQLQSLQEAQLQRVRLLEVLIYMQSLQQQRPPDL
eukprot:m51a1_g11277 hypothetical protein (359) ;mRNA; r:9819-11238